MESKFPWGPVILVGLVLLITSGGGSSPAPDVAPPHPDLVPAFATNDDRAEACRQAAQFGALCQELADCLEYDGGLPDPRLKTGVAIDDLRWSAREMQFRGAALGTKYPLLKETLAEFFTATVGTSGGKLDLAKRQQWIAAFRQLAKSAAYAAKRG